MAWLGVEIGGTKLQAAVVDAGGGVTALRREPVDARAGAAPVLASLGRMLAEVMEAATTPPEAVGVGFGGPVDRLRGGVVACHQVAGWAGFPLAAWFYDRLGLRVVVENDSNAAAFAESVVGAGRGYDAVVYSNVGSGVGAGLVIDGMIHHGRVPGEMEVGHLRLSADGPTLEEVVSGWSLDRQVRLAVEGNPRGGLAAVVAGGHPSARHLAQAIARGDAEAAAILDRAARHYALGLSHVVHLINPDVLVLGGGVAGIGEPWRAAVERQLEGFVLEALRPPPPVRLAALGDDVVPIGAALVAAAARADRR